MEVNLHAYIFEFPTKFSNLKPDWSKTLKTNAIAHAEYKRRSLHNSCFFCDLLPFASQSDFN